MYHPNVGHLFGEPVAPFLFLVDSADLPLSERQAEGADAFSQFHLYVCSAFLVKWSEKLQKMDFQVSPFEQVKSQEPSTHLGSRSTGDHHVFAKAANRYLERSRRRIALVRGVRSQVGVAWRREPFQWRSRGPARRRYGRSMSRAGGTQMNNAACIGCTSSSVDPMRHRDGSILALRLDP